MTKSKRAKKEKKKDFTKVKLKVGKTVKKAQNETRTDFQARKIILREQLAVKAQGELITKKQHNIKELLSRLNHGSAYVRQDGLTGLKELVAKNDSIILIPLLPVLLPGLAKSLIDLDPLIRSGTVKLIEAIIIKVGNGIEPYFSILGSHLACAMVHLNAGVQGDSLQLIRVLIKHTPQLLARHSDTLLNNFINLISRKANNNKELFDVGKRVDFSRLLHVSPENKLTSLQWRLRLFGELSSFLEAILRERSILQASIPHNEWQTIMSGCIAPIQGVDHDSGLRDSSVSFGQIKLLTNPKYLAKFCGAVIPLLFQTWAEVDPQKSDQSSIGDALSKDAIETLVVLVSLMTQLWDITEVCVQCHPGQCDWFMKLLKLEFVSSIMAGFPYSRHQTPLNKQKQKAMKEDKVGNVEEHCDAVNVSLVVLSGRLFTDQETQIRIAIYLSGLLCDEERDGKYNTASVVKMLQNLFVNNKNVQQCDEDLLSSVVSWYQRMHPLRKDRGSLLQLLLILSDTDHKHLWGVTCIVQWIEQLIKDLSTSEVHDSLLHTVLMLKLCNTGQVQQLLQTHQQAIRDNVSEKGVLGLSSNEVDLMITSLFRL